MIELHTLGAVDLRSGDGREVHAVLAQPKRIALLIYLAVAQPVGMHRRDILLGLFWPELDQPRARGALRKALHVLRRSLGPATFVGRGDEEVGLAEGAIWCDAVAYEHAIAQRQFDQALELYRGDFLDGFFISAAPEFERWVDRERARLRERAALTAWALAEQAALAGQDVLGVKWGRRAMDLMPTDEGALRHLITLFYRLGDRAAALRAYTEFSARLLAEYGVRPSAETRHLIEAVKASREIPISRADRQPARPPSKPTP